ncbi:MAG: LysR family transcriptional regulator [Candidatus Cryptobacteroides sp.]
MLEDFRLKVFITVVNTGSFTAAARLLGISQPAVSQNISALEKELDVRLFNRLRSEVVLTGQGSAFLKYAEHILYWCSAAGDMFGEEGRNAPGKVVRISADQVVADYLIPPALSVLSSAHPDLLFQVTRADNRDRTEVVSDVPGSHFGDPQDAEVEITVSPSPETMDFAGEEKLVGVMDAVVVASPQNRSVLAAAVSEDDNSLTVKPFSTIAGIPVSNRFAVWDGYCRFFSPDLVARTSLTSASAETVKRVVSDSVSMLGIVPEMSVREEIASGKLLRMPIRLPDYSYDVHFNPLPEFSGKTVCRLLRRTLRDSLSTT